MAVALEQEMKAKAQEARAKVTEAEAEIPKAIAEAFVKGNLGVMDYYKMQNVQADTDIKSVKVYLRCWQNTYHKIEYGQR